MRSFRRQVSVATLLMAIMAGPAMGQTYSEVGDADIWIPGQTVNIAANAIEGNLDTTGPEGADIDLYRVCLTGNQTFSASTSSADGGMAIGLDPVLFLFDSNGRAVYYNNNIDSSTSDARLPAGHTLTPIAAGAYHLAISNGDATAGGGGSALFDQPGTGIGGPLTGNELDAWSVNQFTGGDYRIALTGAAACPDYTVSEFLPPINPLALNVVNAGATVAVRWLLTDSNGNPVDDPSSFVSITSVAPGGASCAGLPPEAVEPAAGNSGLQYLGDGLWQFNWKVPKSYADQCRLMKLTLIDGSEVIAAFQFQ